MFPSLSKCQPGTAVRSNFVADDDFILNTASSNKIIIDGAVTLNRPIFVRTGSSVSIEVTSSIGYSQYKIVSYSKNGVPLSFAVVNEMEVPSSFTVEGLKNEWYNFSPDIHKISYRDLESKGIRSLGYNTIPFYSKNNSFLDFSSNKFTINNPGKLTRKNIQSAEYSPNQTYFKNNYLTINESALRLDNKNFTIEFWIKPTSSKSYQFICGTSTIDSAGNNKGWGIYLQNMKINFSVDNALSVESTQLLNLNSWYHIAVTRSSNNVRVWINGVLSKSQEYIFNDSYAGKFKIGSLERNDKKVKLGNRNYSFEGFLGTLRFIKDDCIYTANFTPPAKCVQATQKTVLLTLQEDPESVLDVVAIPDPLTSTVYFYNKFGQLLENLKIPDAPIHVERLMLRDELCFVVSTQSNLLYKITLDKDALFKLALKAIGISSGRPIDWLFELSYETDIPFFGSFSAYARYKKSLRKRIICNYIKCVDDIIWSVGGGSIWKIDKNFQIIKQLKVSGIATGIVPLENDILFVSFKDGSLRRIDFQNETTEQIFKSTKISPPIIFNQKLWISDSINKRLVSYTINSSKNLINQTFVLTGNFNPGIISASNTNLFVAGNDTNIVKIYDGTNFQSVEFDEKVIWVKPFNNAIFASHFNKDENVLAHTSASILPLKSQTIIGPYGEIGNAPQKIKLLGKSDFQPILPTGVTHWVNGSIGENIKHGNLFSVSANIQSTIVKQFPIIIGDTAFDFIVSGSLQTYYPRLSRFKTQVMKDSDVKINFTIPYYFSPFLASINYGKIQKNLFDYDGSTTIDPGDFITIIIPKADTNYSTCPTLTLGAKTYLLPISTQNDVNEDVSFTEIQKNINLANLNYSVIKKGNYFIPYFKNTVVTVNGQPTTFNKRTVLNVGDNINVSLTSSNRIFDENQYCIVGEKNFIHTNRTVSGLPRDTIKFNNIELIPQHKYFFNNISFDFLQPSVQMTLYGSSSNILMKKPSITVLDTMPQLSSIFVLDNHDVSEYSNSITVTSADVVNFARVIENVYEDDQSVLTNVMDTVLNENVPVHLIEFVNKSVTLQPKTAFSTRALFNRFPILRIRNLLPKIFPYFDIYDLKTSSLIISGNDTYALVHSFIKNISKFSVSYKSDTTLKQPDSSNSNKTRKADFTILYLIKYETGASKSSDLLVGKNEVIINSETDIGAIEKLNFPRALINTAFNSDAYTVKRLYESVLESTTNYLALKNKNSILDFSSYDVIKNLYLFSLQFQEYNTFANPNSAFSFINGSFITEWLNSTIIKSRAKTTNSLNHETLLNLNADYETTNLFQTLLHLINSDILYVDNQTLLTLNSDYESLVRRFSTFFGKNDNENFLRKKSTFTIKNSYDVETREKSFFTPNVSYEVLELLKSIFTVKNSCAAFLLELSDFLVYNDFSVSEHHGSLFSVFNDLKMMQKLATYFSFLRHDVDLYRSLPQFALNDMKVALKIMSMQSVLNDMGIKNVSTALIDLINDYDISDVSLNLLTLLKDLQTIQQATTFFDMPRPIIQQFISNELSLPSILSETLLHTYNYVYRPSIILDLLNLLNLSRPSSFTWSVSPVLIFRPQIDVFNLSPVFSYRPSVEVLPFEPSFVINATGLIINNLSPLLTIKPETTTTVSSFLKVYSSEIIDLYHSSPLAVRPEITSWTSSFAKMTQLPRIQPKINNFPITIKYKTELNKDYVFATTLLSFYGFFTTSEDALTAAFNRNIEPILLYKVPGTNKWTFRKIYTVKNVCDIYDRPRFYVQGG